jgi:hypothetical protein
LYSVNYDAVATHQPSALSDGPPSDTHLLSIALTEGGPPCFPSDAGFDTEGGPPGYPFYEAERIFGRVLIAAIFEM